MKHHHHQHEPHDTSDPHDETNFLESACTSVTEEESEENSSSSANSNNNSTSSWFGAWASTLRETAGGVVKVVKTCAINVAAEIALLEDEESLLDGSLPQQQSSSSGEEPWHLPWEIRSPETGEFYEDMDLQQRIVQLSRNERNFLEPYSSAQWNNRNNCKDTLEDSFVLDDARVHVIRQLLTRDPQLAAAHARWSGRPDVHEVTFWRNYFHACDQTRKAHVNEEEDDDCVMKNRHGLGEEEEEESVLESSNLEELSQKSLASQRSVNSLVPDDESSDTDRVNDVPNSPESLADDSSYVCVSTGRTSPLGSVKSIKSTRSAGSLVMVEAPFSAQNSFLDYGSGKL